MLILIPNIDVKMLKLMQYFIIYDETIQSNQDIIILTGKKRILFKRKKLHNKFNTKKLLYIKRCNLSKSLSLEN